MFLSFWILAPALLYGLSTVTAVYTALNPSFIQCIVLAFLWIPLLYKRAFTRFFLSLLSFFLTFGYISYNYQFENIEESGIAEICIEDIKPHHSPFKKGWCCSGTLKSFVNDDRVVRKIRNAPFSLVISDPINEGGNFRVPCKLKSTKGYSYILTPLKGITWEKIKEGGSLAGLRMKSKQAVKQYLRQVTPHKKAAAFLCGIATGEFEDRMLVAELSRFGLQHIMAISGFHFSVVALLISFLLRFLLNRQRAAKGVIFLLTGYFLFLGCTPSILRSWISATIFFCGMVAGKKSIALNSLGVALLAAVLWDPIGCTGLGFQFSYLTTAAILLFYSPADKLLHRIFVKRSLGNMLHMNLWNQHGHLLMSILRQGLSLTLAVHLVAVPVVLLYFHKFPLMGLIYNLFFPFLVSISMFLLLIGMCCDLLQLPFSGAIHGINSSFTEEVLGLTYNIPITMDYYVRYSGLKEIGVGTYFVCLLALGIYLNSRNKELESERDTLPFL